MIVRSSFLIEETENAKLNNNMLIKQNAYL